MPHEDVKIKKKRMEHMSQKKKAKRKLLLLNRKQDLTIESLT